MIINTDKSSFIGVFDSGVGGISVLKEMIKIMPHEDFVYFGDSINAPYGTKSREIIRELTVNAVNNLLSDGAKAICIACNTATSAAVSYLRELYPGLPIVGIEPAIKPAAEGKENPNILVMATPMTIRMEKFQNLLARFEYMATIHQLSCPGLMEFIESGIFEGPKLESFLEDLLFDYRNKNLDYVVLGCTHYPFIKDSIQKALGNKVSIIDGSIGTARELKKRIELAGLSNDLQKKGSLVIKNSDPSHIELSRILVER